jgi:hypothetical protein
MTATVKLIQLTLGRMTRPPVSGTFHIIRSSNATYYAVQFGLAADTPAPADFDGDGKADLAVWRNTGSVFYSSNSSNGNLAYFEFRDSSNQLIPSTETGPSGL